MREGLVRPLIRCNWNRCDGVMAETGRAGVLSGQVTGKGGKDAGQVKGELHEIRESVIMSSRG